VSIKANEGGGWFTWVFSTENISLIESKFGRSAIEGNRTLPNGTELRWKQIGVREIADTREFPFFIEWLSSDHPSSDGEPKAEIKKIVIADHEKLTDSWFKDEILNSLGGVSIEWIDPELNDNQTGIVSVQLFTSNGLVMLD
jgi:hypothetical protein